MPGKKDNQINRRSILRKTAIVGGVTVAPGVVSGKESDDSINGVPYEHAVEGKDYDAYEALLTDENGEVTFENIDFDRAEIVVSQPDRENRNAGATSDPGPSGSADHRIPDQSEYRGPPEGIKVYHGKYKNAEPRIDPIEPESEQLVALSDDTYRSGRYTVLTVPDIVPGVGGCEAVVGYDADFQLSPAKYVDLSVGVGLCGNYLEIAGAAVGYLSDEYFCVSPPRNLPIDVSGCLSANWTSDDELEVSGGLSLAIPKNNPCSPAKCQVQRDFTVDWTIAAP